MTVAKKLRALRQRAGLTVPQLAERAKLTRQAITALERGDREPSLETARKLCQALNVSLSEFDR